MVQEKTPKKAPQKAVKPAGKTLKKAISGVSKNKPLAHAVGRRKKSVARVWLRPGSGSIIVNGQDFKEYFDTSETRRAAQTPFKVCPVVSFNVDVNVFGGGKVGQADAVKLAIARAFIKQDETLRPVLKKQGLLSVDSRVKERKKYGQRGARRKFQFVKR